MANGINQIIIRTGDWKNRINVGYKLLNAHTKELNTWKPPLNKQSKIQKPIKPKLQKTHKSKSTFCFFFPGHRESRARDRTAQIRPHRTLSHLPTTCLNLMRPLYLFVCDSLLFFLEWRADPTRTDKPTLVSREDDRRVTWKEMIGFLYRWDPREEIIR